MAKSRPGKLSRAWKAYLRGKIINFAAVTLKIMCKFIEFWTGDNGVWKRMVVNVAHIVWFEEGNGNAVIYLSPNPGRAVVTDYPFDLLYENLTGEKP